MKTAYVLEDIERKAGLTLCNPGGNSEPVGARQIADRLPDGESLNEGSVRRQLRFMDGRVLMESVVRGDGRLIAKLGADELAHARVRDKIGFVISKIEVLAFKTILDPHTLHGYRPVEVSLFPKVRLKKDGLNPVAYAREMGAIFPEEDRKGRRN